MQTSPKILGLSWGSVETEAGTFRDAKLWPGGARGWDWTETGTSHTPGIQATDVAEVLDRGAEVIVLGRGQQERLQVTDAAVTAITDDGATIEMLKSRNAVERYNELVAQNRPVAALIHSTC